jgi:hypothetical protein
MTGLFGRKDQIYDFFFIFFRLHLSMPNTLFWALQPQSRVVKMFRVEQKKKRFVGPESLRPQRVQDKAGRNEEEVSVSCAASAADAETGFNGKDVKSFTRVDRKCVHVMMCEIPVSMPRRIHPCIVGFLELLEWLEPNRSCSLCVQGEGTKYSLNQIRGPILVALPS